MAGKEYKGILFADASKFETANFIIVPTKDNTKEAIATAYQLAEILGFSRISELSTPIYFLWPSGRDCGFFNECNR